MKPSGSGRHANAAHDSAVARARSAAPLRTFDMFASHHIGRQAGRIAIASAMGPCQDNSLSLTLSLGLGDRPNGTQTMAVPLKVLSQAMQAARQGQRRVIDLRSHGASAQHSAETNVSNQNQAEAVAAEAPAKKKRGGWRRRK